MKITINLIVGLLIFFVLVMPTSQISNPNDYGKLIREHKKVSREFQDDYEVVLAISTVNTTNNLTDDYKIPESISYLRRLVKNKYRLVPYQVTVRNEDGTTSTETRIREVLIGSQSYQGEELIQFSAHKMEKTKEDLLEYSLYHALLKFEYIFPEESPEEDIVIRYEMTRLSKFDIIYDNDGKQAWFEFLSNDGLDSIYNTFQNGDNHNSIDFNYVYVTEYSGYDSSKGDIIDLAEKYLGRPYQWGATVGKTNSFDCSSYTCYLYKQSFGIDLPRVSYNQYTNAPTKVDKNSLQTGDLVFFNTGAGNVFNPITHVGIYIGNGQFIHASSDGVKKDSLYNKYWDEVYRGAGRY